MAYPYQKHIWVTREIIRREYLQNIEDGIYDEQQERLLAEGALEQEITAEENRAKSAENTLDLAIQAETTRATNAENELRESVTRAYKVSGNSLFENLPTPDATNLGCVYNVIDDFVTTTDFVEGEGKSYPAGTNVVIIKLEDQDVYKYDVFSGFIDLSHFITDSSFATIGTAGIVRPDGVTTSVTANGTISVIGGGGSGGHTILDSDGNELPQEDNLQFMDSIITDDDTNGITIVRPSHFIGTSAQWNALSASEQAKYNTKDITDDFNGATIDSLPTQGSTNAVSSGGVYAYINTMITQAISASY